jgi:hypothetical protein
VGEVWVLALSIPMGGGGLLGFCFG